MSLTLNDLELPIDMRTLIDTILTNNLSNEERKEIGIDYNSKIVFSKVDVICKKLGITEEELTKRINDLYETTLDVGNIRARLITAMVGFINEVKIIGIHWSGLIMSTKGND